MVPPMTRNQRQAKDLTSMMPRSAAFSHLARAAEVVAPPNRPPESQFSPRALWQWIRTYLAYVFHPKHDFVRDVASPQKAVYDLVDQNGSENVRISVAGDWGTGTNEAQAVADQMVSFDPHFTIHIGDVYYVGDLPAINENCLGRANPNNNYIPVKWPHGSCGSFALNGNHEMYANGNGYFELFLPTLGLNDAAGQPQGQKTSFFCLQNKHWRVIAIDTGYNSVGVPILAHIPLINRIPFIGGDCRLPDQLIEWLKAVVVPDQDKRGLIIVSHHQYYSGFDTRYTRPAQQLWDAGVQRPVLWFWGHEHRLAGYDLFGSEKLKAYGRCIGHGGMPVDRGDPNGVPKPIFYDNRTDPNSFGVNGHVDLSFTGPKMTAVYVDLNGYQLLKENWTVGASGSVQFEGAKKLIADPDFHA